MDLTESTNTMQVTPTTLQKPFPFLELPGELRNMVYELVSEDAETAAVMPIIKRPQTPGTIQTEAKAYALLRTCKQIRAEYWLYIHGVVHGTIYWPRHSGYMEARVPWGLAFTRTRIATEIARNLQEYGHMFRHIRHLDLHGSGANSLILDLVDYDEERLDGRTLSHTSAAQKRSFLRRLRYVVQNVETLTLYSDRDEVKAFLQQGTGFERHRELSAVLPKLTKIRFGTPDGMKVVAWKETLEAKVDVVTQREFVDVKGDVVTWKYSRISLCWP